LHGQIERERDENADDVHDNADEDADHRNALLLIDDWDEDQIEDGFGDPQRPGQGPEGRKGGSQRSDEGVGYLYQRGHNEPPAKKIDGA